MNSPTKNDSDIRSRIVREAKHFVGVRFVHQGRTCHGVDCAGLLYCVFNSVIGIDDDYSMYPAKQTSAMVFRRMRNYADRIPKPEAGPGDVILMHFQGSSTHLGILTDTGVVHADDRMGRVIEHSIDEDSVLGSGRVVAYFRMRGVCPWLA